MKFYDVIVIGAGPAGLFTAINCGKKDTKVLVLEKNQFAGKKLLLSGAGQCNITHQGNMKDFLCHYGENYRFLKHSLFNFTNEDLLRFFKKRGLNFVINDNGKIFPETLKASDVLNILIKECNNKNIKVKYDSNVEDVTYNEQESFFSIKLKSKEYKSRFLVITTGGKSYQATGSTGDGYKFAANLGHNVKNPLPTLTPIHVEEYAFRDLSGISFQNVPISLWRNNKKIKETKGDVLLTHNNISGPGILNFSRYILPGDTIKINFVGEENIHEFRKKFIHRITSNGNLMIKTLLRDYTIPKRFINYLLDVAEIKEDTTGAHLNKKKRNKLIEMLVNFPMVVERLGGFHIAMATKGGVFTKEVNPKTMESRKIKGLYFAGEVLDIDGDTGGYNIQAAFSTGYIAGCSIVNDK